MHGREEYEQAAREIANQLGVPEELVFAVIEQESSWDHFKEGGVGEIGLMQFRPGDVHKDAAYMEGLTYPYNKDLTNYRKNLQAGVGYLKHLLNQFGGDYRKALQSYNAGPDNAFDGPGTVPHSYATSVMNKIKNLGFRAGGQN